MTRMSNRLTARLMSALVAIALVFSSTARASLAGPPLDGPKAKELAKATDASGELAPQRPAKPLRQVDVLLITGPGGHMLASNNIEKRLKEAGLTYAVFDFASLSAWTFEDTLKMLEEQPEQANKFYEDYYKQAKQVKRPAELPQAQWHSAEQFLSAMNVARPKVILSTYAIAMESIDRLKAEGRLSNIPVGLIPTDYNAESYWTGLLPKAADKIFAPSEAWAKTAQKNGTPAAKLAVTGIPGNPRSDQSLSPVEVEALWQHLGLDRDVTTVIVAGGSGGVGTFDAMLDSIRKEFKARPEHQIQVVFAVGGNKKALEQIQAARATMPANLKIAALGFTPNFPDYLNNVADIVVSKAGGLTTTEVARSRGMKNGVLREGRPFLITTPSYGIEPGNAEIFFKEGMARPTRIETLGADLAGLLDHPELQEQMMRAQGQIRAAAHPEEIVEWAKKEVSRSEAPYVAAENPKWAIQKIRDSVKAGKAPNLRVSDADSVQLVRAGDSATRVFSRQQNKINAAANEAEIARLKTVYPARTADPRRERFQIAVTVDDLPMGVGGYPPGERRKALKKMIEVLKGHGITDVTGFVNTANLEGWTEVNLMLKDWLDAGFKLGNHTHSHGGLNAMAPEDYIKDIRDADRFLTKLGVPKDVRRNFRYPMLQEGDDFGKRQQVLDYLQKNGYTVAPVTVDSQDYTANIDYTKAQTEEERARAVRKGLALGVRDLTNSRVLSQKIFGRQIPHVLLLHLSAVTPHMLDSLLGEYEKRGAEFIGLETALKDPIYRVDHGQVAEGMVSFIKEMAYATGEWTPEPERKGLHTTEEVRAGIQKANSMKMCRDLFRKAG